MSKKNDIVIVLDVAFPYGMAAANRVLSYAIELAKKYIVKVYIPLPTEEENNCINKKAKGVFKGVNFEYVNKSTIWYSNYSYLKKTFLLIKIFFKLLVELKMETPHVLIFYGAFTKKWTVGLILFSRLILGSTIIIEENEYPKVLKQNLPELIKNMMLYVYRIADGMFVMTNELKTYYKSINIKRVFVLPMTVDFERYSTIQNGSDIEGPYFAYVGGNGGFVRDGLLDSVKGFNLFHKKYKIFKFCIIGPIEENDTIYLELKEYIFSNGLEDSILFLGAKPSYEIPIYLQAATGLIMTPPKDYTSGGFPTKLGEYLASGRPVITTVVSDIPKYLNREDAFLIEPGNIQEIYDKLVLIVENPVLADSVGKNGKLIAESIFSAKRYMKSFEQFLFS